jgi:opacity protein-like surface antigen
MKKLLLVISSIVLIGSSNAESFSLAVGSGKETITSPKKFTVDLYQAIASYKFDNNVYVAGSVQNGYPDSTTIPDESRYEGIVGYATKIGNFTPYAQIAYGDRAFNSSSVSSYNYYALTFGTKYIITDKIYTDLRYRFRDNIDTTASWKTNLYGGGIGYKLTSTLSVEAGYAYTTGDYTSNQWGIFLINKF